MHTWPMFTRTILTNRLSILAVGTALALSAAACGSSGGSSSAKVASLGGNSGGGAAAGPTTTVNVQEAMLSYTTCMRDHGVNMPDPTFDANGNPTGGGFGFGGRGNDATGTTVAGATASTIDRNSTAFRDARKACGTLLQGVTFGGRRGQFDRQAVQDGLNKFTTCLRDNGVTVNDITLPQPGQGGGAQGGGGQGGGGQGGGGQGGGQNTGAAGSVPVGGGAAQGGGDGPPPGGFDGPPPGDQPGANAPGGAGGNRENRILSRLGLDQTDPTVMKAMTACQPILDQAFTPSSTTTTQAG